MEPTPSTYDVATLSAALGRAHLYAGWDCGCIAVGEPERLRLEACKRHRVLGMPTAQVYRPERGRIAS